MPTPTDQPPFTRPTPEGWRFTASLVLLPDGSLGHPLAENRLHVSGMVIAPSGISAQWYWRACWNRDHHAVEGASGYADTADDALAQCDAAMRTLVEQGAPAKLRECTCGAGARS